MTTKPEPSTRDPLSEIKGDATLDAVWARVEAGEAQKPDRALIIEHLRRKRREFIAKDAKKDE